jgi:hypothetical protein
VSGGDCAKAAGVRTSSPAIQAEQKKRCFNGSLSDGLSIETAAAASSGKPEPCSKG